MSKRLLIWVRPRATALCARFQHGPTSCARWSMLTLFWFYAGLITLYLGKHQSMKLISTAAAIAGLISLSPAPAKASEIIDIVQGKPQVVHIDLGAGGASHGDLMAFEAPFTGENGVVGVINGITFTIDVPDGKDRLFDRFGNILLNFGEGSSLVVGGGAVYSLGAGEMEPDTPQVRAITGGTGRFIGARGQITTIRLSAGHYEHRIELLD